MDTALGNMLSERLQLTHRRSRNLPPLTPTENIYPNHQTPSLNTSLPTSPSPTPREISAAFLEPPFSFHGILLTCFYHPSSICELAPAEERGQFQNRKHGKRYKLLKQALKAGRRSLKALQLHAANAAPQRWKEQQKNAAQAFHDEFTARLSWGDPEEPDYDPNDRTVEQIQNQEPNSVFPSINIYIRNFPRVSIAWAVRDFYRREEQLTQDYRALLELKHQWDWCELHYFFFRAVSGMPRSFGIKEPPKPHTWAALLGSKSDAGTRARGFADLVWSLDLARSRRDEQFKALKQIRSYLKTVGMEFPLSFCPGGSTVVEFFAETVNPGLPNHDHEARRMFRRREDSNVWKNPEAIEKIRAATDELLDSERLKEYFERNPVDSGSERTVSTVEASMTSTESGGDENAHAGSEGSLVGNVLLKVENGKKNKKKAKAVPSSAGTQERTVVTPGPSATEASRLLEIPVQVAEKPGWFTDYRAGWPLGLRA